MLSERCGFNGNELSGVVFTLKLNPVPLSGVSVGSILFYSIQASPALAENLIFVCAFALCLL